LMKDEEREPAYRWWIRERGTFDFVGFQDSVSQTKSLPELQFEISQAFVDELKPYGAGAVLQIYEAWDRNRCSLQSMSELRNLKFGVHLEVILENPGWKKRAYFVEWWEKNGKPLGYKTIY